MLLTRAKRGVGAFRTAFYLPALVPPVASVVAFVFLFNPSTGPVNTIIKFCRRRGSALVQRPGLSKPSLVLLGVWVLGDMMIIFLAALLDVPREQYEAAELDGANASQRFRFVTLPNLVPVLVFALVIGVIAALQYFTEAAVARVAAGKAVVGGTTKHRSATRRRRSSRSPGSTYVASATSSSDTPRRWRSSCSSSRAVPGIWMGRVAFTPEEAQG